METSLAISNSLLDPTVISKLETYEDFLAFYIQLEQVSSISAWLKADTLYALSQKFGEKSIEKFSIDIKQPRSTIINYVRVSKAFPIDKRITDASFSLHFQASFADSYDEKTGKFLTDTRQDWLEKATDSGWSTRMLNDKIQQEKKKLALHVTIIPCKLCKKGETETFSYIFYSPERQGSIQRFNLHPECYEDFIAVLKGEE